MTPVRVTRSPLRAAADPSQVVTRLFVPGQESFELRQSRGPAQDAESVDRIAAHARR